MKHTKELFSLDGKVAVVTGGRGLYGASISLGLCEMGARTVIALRMEHASLLLRTTSMRVQDVIEAIGYSSYEAFYKAFISKFGVNPQKYRQANKK